MDPTEFLRRRDVHVIASTLFLIVGSTEIHRWLGRGALDRELHSLSTTVGFSEVHRWPEREALKNSSLCTVQLYNL